MKMLIPAPHCIRGLTTMLSPSKTAMNLYLIDFRGRFLPIDDIEIPLTELMVIERFKPAWNCLFEGFGKHSLNRGRSSMMPPSWDWFYPGRVWEAYLQPFTKSI